MTMIKRECMDSTGSECVPDEMKERKKEKEQSSTCS
jgi:hypothetical protein